MKEPRQRTHIDAAIQVWRHMESMQACSDLCHGSAFRPLRRPTEGEAGLLHGVAVWQHERMLHLEVSLGWALVRLSVEGSG